MQNIDISDRERINARELREYRQAFQDHYRIAGSAAPIIDDHPGFRWIHVRSLIDSSASDAPLGLYFSYGLEGTAFAPIMNLYKAGSAGYRSELIGTRSYLATQNDWQEISATDRERMESAYRAIQIRPLPGANWRPFKGSTPTEPNTDIVGIHYRWDRIKTLFDANPAQDPQDDLRMIVSCLCFELDPKYQGEPYPLLTENRHLLSLHVARRTASGLVHLLDDNEHPAHYAMKAMDYGSVCPPNCPKRN